MTTTFFQKNTLNGANLEREIDQKNNVIHNVIDDIITTAASKGSFTTSNP